MFRFIAALAAALSLSVAAGQGQALAQSPASDYPNRPIRLLQGFAPGGNADVISRVLAEELGKALGQPVLAEPKPGAGGNLASELVAKSAPDGYTLLLLTTGHPISAALYNSLNFDPVNDFQFITAVSDFPFFFVVNANSKYKTMADLVAAARMKAGAVSYGSAGVGTGQHLTGELFATAIKAKLLHVPFRGDSAALNGLLSGDIDVIIAPVPAIAGNLDGGTVRALGTSGAQRWPAFPDVPTLAETVAPGFDFMAYVALAAPKGVPAPIVARLNAETRKILAMPAIEKRLRDLGGTAKSSTPDEMKQKVASSIARFKAVIDEAGIARQ